MSTVDKARLQRLWLEQQAQGKVPFVAAPARFRETLGDAEKTLPPEEPLTPEYIKANTTSSWQAALLQEKQRKAKQRRAPGQDEACMRPAGNPLADTGEWALLDALEVHMYNQEADALSTSRRCLQDAQRRFLDSQVAERQAQKAQDQAGKLMERQHLEQQYTQFQAEEAQRAEQLRQRLQQLKADRATQVEAACNAKQQLRQKQAEEEATEQQRIRLEEQAQEEKQKARIAQRQEAARLTLEENRARLAARKEAQILERRQDEEMMAAMGRELERQEREREEKLRQFQEMVAARSAKVGELAATEIKDKMQKEEERTQMVNAEKARQDAEQEAAQLQRRKAMQQETLNCLQKQLNEKQQRLLEAKQEAERLKQEMKRRAHAEEELERRKLEAQRARNVQHLHELLDTVQQRSVVKPHGDTFMSREEKLINAVILEQAVNMLGEPKIVPVAVPPQGKARVAAKAVP